MSVHELVVGSLFSGVGGFDLGLERTGGFRTAWFCEQDDFCQRVLAEHWPGVPCYPDITQLRGADVEPVDVLCGGFPCQNLSRAGRREGLGGAKSGLWSEFARLIRDLRPRYVLVENVRTITSQGRVGRVLGDLAACGLDAEWDCIPASAVGAPHPRDRFWLLAYPGGGRHGAPQAPLFAGRTGLELHGRWPDEPDVPRVAHELPNGVDRRRALGNALIPAIAEWLGQRILDHERQEGRLAA
jgi:DNA (cytosine-5)-methyltransferase 1